MQTRTQCVCVIAETQRALSTYSSHGLVRVHTSSAATASLSTPGRKIDDSSSIHLATSLAISASTRLQNAVTGNPMTLLKHPAAHYAHVAHPPSTTVPKLVQTSNNLNTAIYHINNDTVDALNKRAGYPLDPICSSLVSVLILISQDTHERTLIPEE